MFIIIILLVLILLCMFKPVRQLIGIIIIGLVISFVYHNMTDDKIPTRYSTHEQSNTIPN